MQTLPQRGDSRRDFATILGDRFWQQITQTPAIVTDMVNPRAMRAFSRFACSFGSSVSVVSA